jgi:hypothetical protein
LVVINAARISGCDDAVDRSYHRVAAAPIRAITPIIGR